jgi:hypothetical protein
VLQKSLLIAGAMSLLLLADCATAQVVQGKGKVRPNWQDLRDGTGTGSLLWAGTRLSRPGTDLQVQLGLPEKEGFVIATVAPGSAADSAGLKANDVLIRINGKAIPNTLDGFSSLLKEQKLDEGAELDIVRGGKEETVRSARFPAVVQLDGASSKRGRGGPIRILQNIFGAKNNRNPQGDEFSGAYSSGDLKITVKGNLKDERTVANIVITEAGETKTYTNVREVPAEYQQIVSQLMPGKR